MSGVGVPLPPELEAGSPCPVYAAATVLIMFCHVGWGSSLTGAFFFGGLFFDWGPVSLNGALLLGAQVYLFGRSWKPVTRLRTEVELRVQEATDLAHPPPSMSATDSFGDIELSGNGHNKSAWRTAPAPENRLFGLSLMKWPAWRRRLLDVWRACLL